MLRKGQYGLQVKNDNGWKWVFCHSESTGGIVTTENARKALPAGKSDPGCIPYFLKKHGNEEFKAERL